LSTQPTEPFEHDRFSSSETEAAGPVPSATPGGIREVFVLALPVILTQISVTAMQTVDSAFVGSLGATELASVGFGGVWVWTAICFFIGLTSAVQTFVAQHHGAGQVETCGDWSWQGIYAAVPLAGLMALVLFLGVAPLMELLRPSDAMKPMVVDYVSARSLGAMGLTVAVALSSFFRGFGDTRTPLYATLVANGVNAVLDYGLIFGELGLPELGVMGAGLATSVAEWVYAGVLLFAFWRPPIRERFRTELVRPDRVRIRRILRTGLPIGGQWWLEMTSFAAFSTLVARLGDTSMAASQAFVVLLSMSFMQAIGISMAVSTLVGQYIGSEDDAYVERSFRSGLGLVTILAGSVALLFALIPGLLLGIFTRDPEVLAIGRPLLVVGALFQLFDAYAIVADGALRGAGDTRWPFWIRFALSWGVFLPLAYLLGFAMEGGLTWAWSGGLVYIALLAGTLVWRFRSGAWKEIEI
jgi:MATE family multidrug resistance protein